MEYGKEREREEEEDEKAKAPRQFATCLCNQK